MGIVMIILMPLRLILCSIMGSRSFLRSLHGAKRIAEDRYSALCST